jgi:hypothetical protein
MIITAAGMCSGADAQQKRGKAYEQAKSNT